MQIIYVAQAIDSGRPWCYETECEAGAKVGMLLLLNAGIAGLKGA